MPPKFDQLPDPLASRLREYYTRKRLYALARILLLTVLLYGGLTLVATHIDRFAFLGAGRRMAFSGGAHAAVGVFFLAGLVLFFLRRPSVRSIVYELESKLAGDVEERFSTLVDVSGRRGRDRDALSRELVEQLRRSTVPLSDGFHAGRLVRDRALPRLAALTAVAALIFGVLAFLPGYQFGLMIRRFLMPWRNLPKPSFVRLEVTPESATVGKGGEIIIEAQTEGQVPAPLRWVMERTGTLSRRCIVAVDPDTEKEFSFARASHHAMSRVHRTLFVFSRTDLQESFRYRVRHGDAQSPIHSVTVMEQPRVTDLRLAVTPPEYSGLPTRTVEEVGGTVEVLEGSKIKLSFSTDRPVTTRRLVFEDSDEPTEPDWDESTRTASHAFQVSRPRTFRIQVTDRHGFSNVERRPIKIVPRKDRPPNVTLLSPPARTQKLPGELLPLQAEARDDLGIVELSLQFRRNPGRSDQSAWQERRVEIEAERPKTIPVSTSLELSEIELVPGDVLAVRLRARDAAGNDGLSRESHVRIVPVTRGVNERLRLVRLDFLRRALAAMLDNAGENREDLLRLEGEVGAKIAEMARARDVQLGESPAFSSLLPLLEREHHFTDRALDKQDVRRLCGVLRHAGMPFGDLPGENPSEFRTRRLRRLGERVLPGLIRYRRLKNVTWRLFGMYHEADRIGGELRAAAGEKSINPDRQKALKRRARLYLDTLQEIGTAIIELSETAEALDQEKVLESFGEINAAAFYLRRGSLAARADACRKLIDLIPAMLDLTRSAFAEMHRGAVRSRADLARMYEQCLRSVQQARAETASALHVRRAEQWLRADLEMMHRNPFAPVLPRLARFAAARDLSGSTTLPPDFGPALVAPEGTTADLFRRERLHLAALAFQSEADRVMGLENISRTEKTLELLSLRMERAAVWASNWERTQLEQRIVAMEIGAEPARENLDEIARPLRDPGAPPYGDALADAPQLREELASPAVQSGLLAPARALLEELTEGMRTSGESIQRISADLREGQVEDMTDRVREVTGALSRQTRLMGSLGRNLYLRLTVADLSPEDQRSAERLMLQVRKLARRYDARVGRSLRSLREGLAAERLETRSVAADLQQIRYVHQAIRKSFLQLIRPAPEAPDQGEGAAQVPESFDVSRAYRSTLHRLARGEGGAEPARNFIARHPEAGIVLLLANDHLVRTASDALTAAENSLAGPDPATDQYKRHLTAARRNITEFKSIIARSGQGRLQEKLARRTTVLLNRLDTLQAGEGQLAEQDSSRLRYGLGKATGELEALQRELDRAERSPQKEFCRFTGGPAGIWTGPLRIHARRTQDRLKRQTAFARRQATAAILAAIDGGSPDRYAAGYGWGQFLYRLARSELCVTGPQTRGGEEEAEERDPHLAFLNAELEKALKADRPENYEDLTERYLRAVKDYLRY